MRASTRTTGRPRRGVTLIEMLVTVALLLLMMTILVGVFRSATGALQTQRVVAQLDQNLRRMDATIRRDLEGVTARMDASQPADPNENIGYFEYIENELPDLQGEDTDDILAFTAKAPEGEPFTGRIWVPASLPAGDPRFSTFQTPIPVTVSSDFAEVIYWVRNGNLYRRVMLIAPQRASSLGFTNVPSDRSVPTAAATSSGFVTTLFSASTPVSWQGLNDISARPAPAGAFPVPVPNDLGDTTDRQNRFCRPRFTDDYVSRSAIGTGPPDNVPDDSDGAPALANGVPDYYPTLYPNVFNAVDNTTPPQLLINENPGGSRKARAGGVTYDTMPFPFIYPGAYSKGIDATGIVGGLNGGAIHFQGPGTYPAALLNGLVPNFEPLDVGESNVLISNPPPVYQPMPVPTVPGQTQTFWGFPTWGETMSPNWRDPVWRVNLDGSGSQMPGLSWVSTTPLPPVSGQINADRSSQVFNDGAGGPAYLMPFIVWEDDLILTGVRSFDVKAYDPSASYYGQVAGYYDLGYATLLAGTPAGVFSGTNPQGFGHEGRIPPLTSDRRVDPQWPALYWPNANPPGYLPNSIGDDGNSVIRLRRTYDTWSTTYSRAPATPSNPLLAPPFLNNGTTPYRPVYPSYPAPYPVPLRGIQVQIRVVDPQNQHAKVLTIRHDFSDKL